MFGAKEIIVKKRSFILNKFKLGFPKKLQSGLRQFSFGNLTIMKQITVDDVILLIHNIGLGK